MSLQDKLLDDLKAAMREHDELRVSTLRMLRSAINYAEIDKRGPLDDAGVLGVIEKDAKRHRESIEAFQKGNRPELAAKEEAELKILLTYLPEADRPGTRSSPPPARPSPRWAPAAAPTWARS